MMIAVAGGAIGGHRFAVLIGQTVITVGVSRKATGGHTVFFRQLNIFMAAAAGLRNMLSGDARGGDLGHFDGVFSVAVGADRCVHYTGGYRLSVDGTAIIGQNGGVAAAAGFRNMRLIDARIGIVPRQNLMAAVAIYALRRQRIALR